MKMPIPSIFVFIALDCEAKPLIRQYNLKKLQQPHPFAIYTADEMALVVSGVGKTAMAGAVAYAMAIFQPASPVLINLGIAGHKEMATGTLLVADKIIDADNGEKKFYPQFIGRQPCRNMPLYTLARPGFSYSSDYLYDMEGAAFYEMAVKFSSCELIQCLKIVSDNQHEPAEQINAKVVGHWIEKQMDSVASIVRQLAELRKKFSERQPALYRTNAIILALVPRSG